jgi:hypothetical protein
MTWGHHALVFFFNSGPKKALISLSLEVKYDQQTHKKNYACNCGINLKKIIQNVPITIFQILLAGRQTHKNKAFFKWV